MESVLWIIIAKDVSLATAMLLPESYNATFDGKIFSTPFDMTCQKLQVKQVE